MYVIYCSDNNSYVARCDSSYTKKLQDAKIYKSTHEAQRDKCGNEVILSIESVLGIK